MSLTIQYDFSPSTFIASSNTITNIAPIINPSQYNGKVYGNPTMGPPGVTSLSTSVSFNTSQYIQLPGMMLPSNGISFSFWFKSNNSPSWARIFDFGNGYPSNNILLTINGGNLEYFVFNGTTSYNKQIASNVNDNKWRHIVWTLSPNPNIWNIYVNGNLTSTFKDMYYPNPVFMNYLYINRSNWGANSGLIGNLADFRIYFGTPLTQSQIANIYNQDMTVSSAVTGDAIINSGYNELYNQIYCDIYPTNNGFNQCQNCNFGNQAVLSTTKQSGEQACLIACKNTPQCTSYSYDLTKSDNNCTQNSNFPTEIINNISQVNSGYSVNKFNYNYNNLSSSQKTNVQKKCAKQYLDNTYTSGKNIDLSTCLNINNSSNLTNFNVDPQCLYNIYNTNNIPTAVINNSTYTDTAPGITSISSGDNTIDNYQLSYKDYTTKQVQISNINNSEIGNDNNNNDVINNNNMFNTFKNDLLENFENNNDNSHYLKLFIILFIIVLIIIIIYIFGKK